MVSYLVDGCWIDFVVFLVSANKLYINDLSSIGDFYHEAILVASDVKNHPVAGYHIGTSVNLPDVRKTLPISRLDFAIPGLDGRLCEGVFFVECFEWFPTDNSHCS